MSHAGSSTGFIFSYNAEDEDIQAIAAALQPTFIATNPSTPRRAGLGAANRRLYVDDDFIPYGPTTYRKGKVRFVPGGLLGGEEALEIKQEKGKGKAIDQDEVKDEEEEEEKPRPQKRRLEGNEVKGLYASIVGIRRPVPSTSSSTIATPARSPSPPERKPKLPSPSIPSLSSQFKEADIVLSSDSEPESPSPADDPDDDDIIIVDPLTNLPEARLPLPPSLPSKKPRLKPRLIHELLGPSNDPILIPPTQYGLHETNFGYRLLSKQGWKEGNTLGKQGGLKVPLKAREKFDRKGLGLEEGKNKKAQWKMTQKEKEEERRKMELEERDKRGRGTRGMARKVRIENAERKAWIAYMNR